MNEYEIEKVSKSSQRIVKLILGLLVVVALVGFIYYQTKINRAASSDSRPVNFKIEKGLTTKQIASSLATDKIISGKNVFIIYVYLHNAAHKIQAGDYALNSNMTIKEIVDVLTLGKVVSDHRTVTLLEGWSNNQIGKYLTDRQIPVVGPDSGSSLKSWNDILINGGFETFKINEVAEKVDYQGFLFPDTYKLGKNEGAYDLVIKMLANFQNQVTEKIIDELGPQRLLEVITLASIVEKEVGRNKEKITDEDLETMQEERRLVASVFYNRLEIGMALESDATVNYVTGKSDRSATIADTKIKSPYNTYQNRGLPPGPISNPGLDSIKAAIAPANSDYLYFLNAPDGTAYFAKTLEEHGENRAKYLR